jgi:hypothetical protein
MKWDSEEQITRLESSARDFAIACIARGERPGSLEQIPRVQGYGRAVEEVAQEIHWRSMHAWRAGGPEPSWPVCLHIARRIVRARLALYLRTLKREEACDRDPFGWAQYQADGAVVLNGQIIGDEETADRLHQYDGGELRGFVPLWKLARPFSRHITPAMRREAMERDREPRPHCPGCLGVDGCGC